MKLSGSIMKWNKSIDVYAISRDTWQQNRWDSFLPFSILWPW
jgi:hypothetical protein